MFALAAASLGFAQAKAAPMAVFANGKHSVTIPLDIDNNIIRMNVRVNGSRPLKMIFDTGATTTGIDEHFVKELGLTTTADKLKGKGTGGSFTGSYVARSTLSVDGVEVTNQPLAAFKINAPPGFDFDGIIGYDFIASFVVEIDYVAKIMTLSDPKTYVYRGRGAVIPLILAARKTPLIDTTFEIAGRAPLAAKLEVDSGFDGSFQLNSPVVKKRRLLKLFPTGTKNVSHGPGGDQQDVVVRFRGVRFGRIKINDPLVALSLAIEGAGATTVYDGLIGGEVLRRFKVIIDCSRKRMILERNKAFDEPYEEDEGE